MTSSPRPASTQEAAREGRGRGNAMALFVIASCQLMVVLDITMPGQNGLEVLKQLKARYPKLPVLMLSMHSGYHYVMGSLKSGASGYLNKETAPEELITAIRKAIDGGIYVSRSLADNLDLDL